MKRARRPPSARDHPGSCQGDAAFAAAPLLDRNPVTPSGSPAAAPSVSPPGSPTSGPMSARRPVRLPMAGNRGQDRAHVLGLVAVARSLRAVRGTGAPLCHRRPGGEQGRDQLVEQARVGVDQRSGVAWRSGVHVDRADQPQAERGGHDPGQRRAGARVSASSTAVQRGPGSGGRWRRRYAADPAGVSASGPIPAAAVIRSPAAPIAARYCGRRLVRMSPPGREALSAVMTAAARSGGTSSRGQDPGLLGQRGPRRPR